MVINVKNQHIFFALEGIWDNLDYRFKYQINQLVSANNGDDFVQQVDVTDTILIAVYRDVSSKPEGVAKAINQSMQEELLPQLEDQSNMDAVIAGTEEPNEAARTLLGIQDIQNDNDANTTARLLNGKTLILA
jgi:hypothetical protein